MINFLKYVFKMIFNYLLDNGKSICHNKCFICHKIIKIPIQSERGSEGSGWIYPINWNRIDSISICDKHTIDCFVDKKRFRFWYEKI